MMIAVKKIVYIALLMLCLACPALSLAKGKYHFKVENSQDGLRLVKWVGKDSVVDFNDIPNLQKVKVIGERAFEMNKYIKRVVLPDGLQTIEKRAFNTCENLQTVKIPNTVRYIGNSAFNRDRKLELSSLPDSLREIGEWTLKNELTKDVTKTMSLLDMGLSYQKKAVKVSLDIRNILNQHHYGYTIYSSVNTFTYNYQLRGRECVCSIKLTM